MTITHRAGAADQVWDFRNGAHGWVSGDNSATVRPGSDGIAFDSRKPGASLTSPPLGTLPVGKVALVTLNAQSHGPDPFATVSVGPEFRHDFSRYFLIPNSGRWQTISVAIPIPVGSDRLRLQPFEGRGRILIRSISLRFVDRIPAQPWADPARLRGKEIVAAGQWATDGTFGSRWLHEHPGFTARFPYTGLVVPGLADLSRAPSPGLEPKHHFVHDLAWTTHRLEWEQLAEDANRWARVNWRHVRHNYLNATLGDASDGARQPDLRSDTDWSVLEHNTRLSARFCKVAGLRGLWLDTEQYGGYRMPNGVPKPADFREGNFPLGRDTPDVLRKRGQQWIRALQSELPEIRILITFAWSPDTAAAGFLKGVAPFLDGVLAAIREPGKLVHSYENSFYYGWGPGNPYNGLGYDGGHTRFERMRLGQRDWRKYSRHPERYDRFVEVGTAAWVEDMPNATWSGWPEGLDSSVWSNLPLAVQHSDRTVWIWSEHTHYGHALDENRRPNPFCFAVANRALPPIATGFSQRFDRDPFQGGWTFDADFLDAGRKRDPADKRPVFDDATVPYRWDRAKRALVVESEMPVAPDGVGMGFVDGQRMRCVRPIAPVVPARPWKLVAELAVDDFGDGARGKVRPLAVGLFATGSALPDSGTWVRLAGSDALEIGVDGADGKRTLARVGLTTRIPRGAAWRLVMERHRGGRLSVSAWVGGKKTMAWSGRCAARTMSLDEVGVALSEAATEPGRPVQRLRLLELRWEPGKPG